MKLIDAVANLKNFSEEETIYAQKPWVPGSEVIIEREPDNGCVPDNVKKMGMAYFLEISIANEFLEDWIASSDEAVSIENQCIRLIQYAINDA